MQLENTAARLHKVEQSMLDKNEGGPAVEEVGVEDVLEQMIFGDGWV